MTSSGGGTLTPISAPTVLPANISANPYPLLSLEWWRRLLGYNPWHFWGLAGTKAPVTSNCNSVVFQYAWQSADAAGRSDISNAIIKAQDDLFPWLGFMPAPTYKEITLPFPRYPDDRVAKLGYVAADNRYITLTLPDKHIRAIGVEKNDLILANAPIVYSDLDGDGLNETWTATLACPSTLTDARDAVVYFNATDRFDGSQVGPRWWIRPVQAKISGANLIIRGNTWLMVRPILYEGGTQGAVLDPSDMTNFVVSVDVYHRYTWAGSTRDEVQAILIWEVPPYPYFGVSGFPYTSTDPAGWAETYARVGLRDKTNGLVDFAEAVYDSATATWVSRPWYVSFMRYKSPDRVVVRYLAGYELDQNGNMLTEMADIMYKLSAAELRRRICACDSANRELYDLQFDLARSSGAADEAYGMISREDLNNPFGTRRGAVAAWKLVKGRRVLTGYVP